jgi:hypothetical protein
MSNIYIEGDEKIAVNSKNNFENEGAKLIQKGNQINNNFLRSS